MEQSGSKADKLYNSLMNLTNKEQILNVLEGYRFLNFDFIEPLNLTIKKRSFTKLPDNFKELNEYIKNCNLCTLSTNEYQQHLGLGDINSDLYIIGTNPALLKGDLLELLKNMIEKVLLRDFDSVYVVNILRCPSSNHTMDNIDQESIDICLQFLDHQIEISKPKLIITLGEAFNYMLNSKEDVVNISGNNYKYHNIDLIPILHPYFISKNPSFKQTVFNDLKKIKFFLEQK